MRAIPTVSVVMGVYQPGEDTRALAAAVQSILSQTFGDLEFLICDEGSSCAITALLAQFAASDSRVRPVHGASSHTLPAKLNACIALAEGRYLARQDDDDISLPERIARQVAFLDAHPESAFVGCNATLFDGGDDYGERCFPAAPAQEDFLFRMPFLHPTLLLRREAVEAVGGYSQSRWTVLCEDYDLLLRLYAQHLSGVNLQERLFRYRVSPQDYRKRRFRHRINEAVTRFCRFRELGMMPQALPYVLKPLAVGVLPHCLMQRLQGMRGDSRWKSS
ncbi:MAG: glycosyltransferase [Oscillospiraceae bacterium]